MHGRLGPLTDERREPAMLRGPKGKCSGWRRDPHQALLVTLTAVTPEGPRRTRMGQLFSLPSACICLQLSQNKCQTIF